MKYFVAFLLVIFLFSGGITVPFESKEISNQIVNDPPHANNVIINARWVFNGQNNVTLVTMNVHNLQSSQYAAMGLGQNQSMVDIER